MKILLTADIHYALKQFDWVVAEAEHYDVVILAGDMLDAGAIASADAQVVVVRAYLEAIAERAQVVVCSGNHDLDRRVEGERVAGWLAGFDGLAVAADGAALRLGDVLISVLPWWDGARGKAAVAAQIARDAEARPAGGTWIWAHHAPPAESAVSWGGWRHYGDTQLTQAIRRHAPDLVCSGHVHQAPFAQEGAWADRLGATWCFNAGHQPGDVPAHVALHLGEREAAWFSMEGGERLRLAAEDGARARLTRAPEWL
ncbi:MAG: metallophosphoesterase [Paracoccaceae bacterium]|nr:metallophosphoesterase [Paracoccaceae bacterium]